MSSRHNCWQCLWHGWLRSPTNAALTGRGVLACLSTSHLSCVPFIFIQLEVQFVARHARHARSFDRTTKLSLPQPWPGRVVVPLPLRITASCSHVRSHGTRSRFSTSAMPVSLPLANSPSHLAVPSVLRSMKRADSLEPSKELKRFKCSSCWVSGNGSVRATPAMQNATSGLCLLSDHRVYSHARFDGPS